MHRGTFYGLHDELALGLFFLPLALLGLEELVVVGLLVILAALVELGLIDRAGHQFALDFDCVGFGSLRKSGQYRRHHQQ